MRLSVESPTHPYPCNAVHKQEISAVLDSWIITQPCCCSVTFAMVWRDFDSTGPVCSRQRFCTTDTEYSIMMQNLIYTSTCKAAVNIKNKEGAWNKHVKWLSFQTMCLWVTFVSGLSCSTERDWSVHFNALRTFFCWSIIILKLRLLNLLFFFIHYETEQQKLNSFSYSKENSSWTWKAWRWAR